MTTPRNALSSGASVDCSDGQKVPMVNFKTYLQPDPTYYFGNRIVDELGILLNQQSSVDRVYLVTDPFLNGKYGDELSDMFARHGIRHRILEVDANEDTKNLETLAGLCQELVKDGISKCSIVIGFGGGCLTNIVGLTAGMIYRGVRCVEMPTTMMAVTDSSLSNKQAVNGALGKNHFGMYYAPIFLFGDTRYMYSEPLNGKRSAIVEGIKNGFISNPELLDYFEKKLAEDMNAYTERDFNDLCFKIIQSKLEILRRDPSEKRYAMTLEYGHTFGHAIEFLTHGKIPHGFAVAKGMCIAAELSQHLGYISGDVVDLHYELLGRKLGLDLSLPRNIGVSDIIRAMSTDNKKLACGVKYVLLGKVGECLNPDGDYQVSVDAETIEQVLHDYKVKTDKGLDKIPIFPLKEGVLSGKRLCALNA
jgi:3-dehydroquinate synthase